MRPPPWNRAGHGMRYLLFYFSFHSIAFSFNHYRFSMMQQPVQHGGGQSAVIVEYFGPFLEVSVCCQDY